MTLAHEAQNSRSFCGLSKEVPPQCHYCETGGEVSGGEEARYCVKILYSSRLAIVNRHAFLEADLLLPQITTQIQVVG